MNFQIFYRYFLITAFVLFSLSCSKESSDKNPSDDNQTQEASERSEQPRGCFSGVVLSLLEDGRTAVVRSIKNNSDLFYWDLLSLKVKKQIQYPFELYSVSVNGTYFIRSLGDIRFQILSQNGERTSYRENLLFTRGSDPILNFSSNGEFVSAFYKSRSDKRNKIIIFDILRRDIVWNATYVDIQRVEFKDDSFIGVISKENGTNYLNIINARTQRMRQLKLPLGQIQSFKLTDNTVLIQVEGRLLVYDRYDLKLVFEKRVKSLIDVQEKSELALVENIFSKLLIVDLVTGEIIRSVRLTPVDLKSTCRFSPQGDSLFCINSSAYSSISHYGGEMREAESFCFKKSPSQ